jgi:beta-fructofuranosidase
VYASAGNGLSEIGDVEVVPAEGELHLFHLTLPNHDLVQHLVSRDGLAWRRLPPALRTGDPGECDDDQIWTMSVTERDGRWVMVYTALAVAERGRVQRTALAYSDDLVTWTKGRRNPIAEADPRWYEADLSTSGSVSWRDPKPIRVGDAYYAAVCARENDGPLMRRGCVGLLASPDLETWEVRPPLFAPRRYWDLECPQVFRIGERFYLTAAIMEDGSQRYWVAPRFEGPYEVPADGGILAPAGHYAGRVCRWRDMDLFVCWHEPRPRSRNSLPAPAVDWATVRNPFGKYLVAPLLLEARPNGSLARRSFPGWQGYRAGTPVPVLPLATSLLRERPTNGGWSVQTEDGGMDVLATDEPAINFCLAGKLRLDAAAGGIAFRLDDEGGGYFVGLRAGSDEATLTKWLPTRDPHDGRRWFRVDELQRGRLRRPLDAGLTLPFTLIVNGPYLECSFDGEVVLATLSAERTSGRVGFWAESGTLTATAVELAPMRVPGHEGDG